MVKHYKTILVLAVAVLSFAGGIFAQEEDTRVVDFRADFMRPVKIGDSSAISLVGHTVFYHNGAVITCDSAVRYSERWMECFNNVIIHKDSTYIYGDRADYNGITNTARVYAPIIKMVDQDATLYTYNFSFNTLDEIGHYSGGGTMSQKDNMLESDEGYYYTSTRDMVAVGNVEMQNPDYTIKSDSVSYNMNTEVAQFLTRSYIWDEDNQILSAYRGEYDTKADMYHFTDSAYIITGSQEVWADTIHFNSATEDALLLNNVQIRDEEQKAMAFGDYVQYWGQTENALLTRNPSVLSFDPQEPDTTYMRSDSMFIYTINRFDTVRMAGQDSLSVDTPPDYGIAGNEIDSLSGQNIVDEAQEQLTEAEGDTLDEIAESVQEETDRKIEQDIEESSPPTKKEIKEERNRLKQLEREQKLKERLERRTQKEAEREAARAEKLALLHNHDHEGHDHDLEGEEYDHETAQADSLAVMADTVALNDSIAAPAAAEPDSIVRELRAYNNVRIFRSDLQAVCDSLVGFSLDSTIYMYKNPVMWNENNQIKSEEVQIFTKNQQIEVAYFIDGEPMMISEVEDPSGAFYNQVKGDVMEAYFTDGEISRMDALGSAQTYYYMEEGDSTFHYVNGFFTAQSADITFRFEDKAVSGIVWKTNPVYKIFPMDLIPADQEQILPGFVWEAERRPSKEDVFTRAIYPSQRVFFESLSRPTYPMTEKINEDRQRLTEEGVWRDRNDEVSIEAQEFIQTLGY